MTSILITWIGMWSMDPWEWVSMTHLQHMLFSLDRIFQVLKSRLYYILILWFGLNCGGNYIFLNWLGLLNHIFSQNQYINIKGKRQWTIKSIQIWSLINNNLLRHVTHSVCHLIISFTKCRRREEDLLI